MSMTQAVNKWSDFLKNEIKICGIVNVTPDSFSDGGNISGANVKTYIDKLISDGATMIDVGAESTRPGAKEISSDEQIKRLEVVTPYIKRFSNSKILFSVDTRSHEVASFAIENGFDVINDVSGGTFDSCINQVIANSNALCILMHSRGTPETMSSMSEYNDLFQEVITELETRIDNALKAGVNEANIMIDPGIGFAKSPEDNIALMENLEKIKEHFPYPMMVGISRKSVTSYILSGDVKSTDMSKRDNITADFSVRFAKIGVEVVRVHDVKRTYDALAGSQVLLTQNKIKEI